MLTEAPHSENRINENWIKLKAGDQQALLGLYRDHYTGLFNFGVKLTGNPDKTRDSITQILLQLWDKRNGLPDVENIRSYLITCLRRELFKQLRADMQREARARIFSNAEEQKELSYEEYIIQQQSNISTRHRLAMALRRLTGREKELLELKFFEDLSYDEIATRCHITKRTAYNIIHTSLKLLKAILLNPDTAGPPCAGNEAKAISSGQTSGLRQEKSRNRVWRIS